jgi:hypothetical protein
VLIVETDLMMAAPAALVRRRIDRAVREAPATADMIYLEYCLESCSWLFHDPSVETLARSCSLSLPSSLPPSLSPPPS